MTSLQTLADALVAPGRGLAAAVDRRTALFPIALATAAALALAAGVARHADHEGAVAARLDTRPAAAAPSAHEREEQIVQGARLARTALFAGAVVLPALAAGGAALGLALGFRLAGARPRVRAALAAASWGTLPLALRDVLTLPALVRHAPVRPDEVARLLPSSLAVLLPRGAAAPLAAAAGALDLFALWSIALVAIGMARAAAVPPRRALVVTAVLWAAWVAVFRVALPPLLASISTST